MKNRLLVTKLRGLSRNWERIFLEGSHGPGTFGERRLPARKSDHGTMVSRRVKIIACGET